MNLLFMTIAYPKYGENNIYSDLMQEFSKYGHQVFVACTNEQTHSETLLNNENGIEVLRIVTSKLTGKVNIIKKGIATITLEDKFIREIKKNIRNIKFDLILYSTPPITFARAVNYIKHRDGAKSYLLLKDIFPQNAVDLGLIKKKSLVHFYFSRKEKSLYRISDYIGCMSQGNVDYILRNNIQLKSHKVEICPNSITTTKIDSINKNDIRERLHIPEDSITFIYGGNLGKPQNIDFIIECLKKNSNCKDRFFIICGNGSDYYKLEDFSRYHSISNVRIINGLPKDEYHELVRACDVGLVFLDHRFTIPNFPSRILSYMEYSMPVLACTDRNTDIGEVIQKGNFGWWCESNHSDTFTSLINEICCSKDTIFEFGVNARTFLEANYNTKKSMDIIVNHLHG